MLAAVVMMNNPFCPNRDREVLPVTEAITVRGWLDAQGISEFGRPTICLLGGEPVLRESWSTTFISDGDVVTFVALPHGGGGGGGGKNPLKTVLSIALMVAAPGLGGALAGSMGLTGSLFAGTAFEIGWGTIMGGVVSLAGSALINAVIPSPRPTVPSMNFSAVGSTPAPSPTYSLSAQGNEARLGQPIPVLYGRHLIYPDLATQPYQEFAGNEQYLFQLHVIGQGEYDLEQVRIEDTPIASFEEVEIEVVTPDSIVTLFETDVITAPEVAGQELLNVADGGAWIGPFTANPAETLAGHLGIDVIFPRGLYYANDAGGLESRSIQWEVQARAIDDQGVAIGSWSTLGSESYSDATNTAQRQSFKYAVTPGRYEVRMQRLDAKDASSRAGHEIRWGGLRSYLQGTPDFGDLTLLAVKMRATDNLSQRSARMINCIVTRRLPVWDPGTGWSTPVPTRSIAWAFADACRAQYGAKLAEARVDLQALFTLDQTWTAREDEFNGIFDSSMTVWEALSRIARCGRAVPVLQGGVVRIFRDAAQTLPVAMFGPRNIVKGSFRIQYVMPGEETADAVTVSFFSSRTWKPDEVTSSLPDGAAEQPAKVALFGCTNAEQAEREGLYMAADNRYRRKLVSWSTELEGMIPTYGDLVAITHDMPHWGQGGEVVNWDEQAEVLTLSEPVTWEPNLGHYIALRRRDGSLAGPFSAEAVDGDSRKAHLLEALGFTPYTDTSEERTHFAFGAGEAWGAKVRVIAVKPRGENVEITAVAEDARVHQADLAA
ncbi:MAG: phage tail protein [Rhodospirillaceae bacterium]|nr:phage tail protein [Rhodospirillaceae bacterium]